MANISNIMLGGVSYPTKDSKANRVFDDIGSAIEAINNGEMSVGEYIRTLGYSSKGDGGGGYYTLVNEGGDINAGNIMASVNVDNCANVKMFGAKGDGVNDDTSSIMRALSVMKSRFNKCLYFPSGTYLLTRTIELQEGTTLKGESKHNTTLKFMGGGNVVQSENFTQLEGGAVLTAPSNFTVTDITVDGNYMCDNGIAVYASNACVKNVNITKCNKNGLYTNYDISRRGVIDTPISLFSDIQIFLTKQHGFYFRGANDSFINRVEIINASQEEDNKYCAFYTDKSNARLFQCHFWNYSDDFGYKRPKTELEIAGGDSLICVECDIEGGRTNNIHIANNVPSNVFSSCRIYASFGLLEMLIDSSYNVFSDCYYGISENNSPYAFVSYSTGLGAGFNKFSGVSVGNFEFIDDVASGYGNRYEIARYYVNRPIARSPQYDKNIYAVSDSSADSETNRHVSYPYKVYQP